MHEHTIANNIIKQARKYGNVESLTIEVGDLAHLPAKEMQLSLEKMTNWQIKVISKKATIACSCGYTGVPKILKQLHDNNVYECPKCKHMLPKIIDGSDIILKNVEVYEDEFEEEDETLDEEE